MRKQRGGQGYALGLCPIVLDEREKKGPTILIFRNATLFWKEMFLMGGGDPSAAGDVVCSDDDFLVNTKLT